MLYLEISPQKIQENLQTQLSDGSDHSRKLENRLWDGYTEVPPPYRPRQKKNFLDILPILVK